MIEILRLILISVSIAGILVTLPGVLELLLVTSGAGRRKAPLGGDPSQFSLAVVVPAHNEEALIGRCVASLLASAEAVARCSIVVVADNCTDGTAQRAREAGARVLVRHDLTQVGKGHALRFAFDSLMHEGFDGFLIVDADSMVSSNLIPAIARGLAGGADAMQTRYRVAQPLDTNRKRLLDVALLAFNVLRPKGRDGWNLSAGILGNGFALSRQTLLAVPYSADSIVEDLEYHLLLVAARKKVRFADAATVYGDMPDDAKSQLSQRARWEGGRVRVAAQWIPKLAFRLLCGKLFLTEPLLELMTLPLAYLAAVAMLMLVLPFGLSRCYGAFVLALLSIHVAAGLALGANAKQSLAALATVPAYMFWKFTSLASILRASRRGTAWLRTGRASEANNEVPHV